MTPHPDETNKAIENEHKSQPNQNINKKIVDEVIAETKEIFKDVLEPVPAIELTFENLSIWAKMSTGKMCKSSKFFSYLDVRIPRFVNW
jgi:hypothetical protein